MEQMTLFDREMPQPLRARGGGGRGVWRNTRGRHICSERERCCAV